MSLSAPTTLDHLYCSICWRPDGEARMILQQCCVCGVTYHNECYGRESALERQNELQCWACLAVGTTVKGRTASKQIKTVRIDSRPTECALCSVDLGLEMPLAMHPLYDNYGPKGRQLILPATTTTTTTTAAAAAAATANNDTNSSNNNNNKPDRAAFCHTLCATFINSTPSTQGCVYGCLKSGDYGGMAEDDDDDDDDSNNKGDDDDDESINSKCSDESNELYGGVHHFVFVLPTKKHDALEKKYTRHIKEHQNKLKCYLCGTVDSTSNSFRIALKCCAKKTADPCYRALHVGCAIWGRDEQQQFANPRRLYFSSPPFGSNHKVSANLYCDTHAMDRWLHAKVEGAEWLRYPGTPPLIAPRKESTAEAPPRPAMGGGRKPPPQPGTSKWSIQAGLKRTATTAATGKTATKRAKSADTKMAAKTAAAATTKSADTKMAAKTAAAEVATTRSTTTPKTTMALPPPPTPPPPPPTPPPPPPSDDLVMEIYSDVYSKCKLHFANKEKLTQLFKERKKHWTQRLQLEKAEFATAWKAMIQKIKPDVRAATQAVATATTTTSTVTAAAKPPPSESSPSPVLPTIPKKKKVANEAVAALTKLTAPTKAVEPRSSKTTRTLTKTKPPPKVKKPAAAPSSHQKSTQVVAAPASPLRVTKTVAPQQVTNPAAAPSSPQKSTQVVAAPASPRNVMKTVAPPSLSHHKTVVPEKPKAAPPTEAVAPPPLQRTVAEEKLKKAIIGDLMLDGEDLKGTDKIYKWLDEKKAEWEADSGSLSLDAFRRVWVEAIEFVSRKLELDQKYMRDGGQEDMDMNDTERVEEPATRDPATSIMASAREPATSDKSMDVDLSLSPDKRTRFEDMVSVVFDKIDKLKQKDEKIVKLSLKPLQMEFLKTPGLSKSELESLWSQVEDKVADRYHLDVKSLRCRVHHQESASSNQNTPSQEDKLERAYADILADARVKLKTNLPPVVLKMTWRSRLDALSKSDFHTVWSRVEDTVIAEGLLVVKKTDWSFLEVGPNYDPKGIDCSKWDTFEVITKPKT